MRQVPPLMAQLWERYAERYTIFFSSASYMTITLRTTSPFSSAVMASFTSSSGYVRVTNSSPPLSYSFLLFPLMPWQEVLAEGFALSLDFHNCEVHAALST